MMNMTSDVSDQKIGNELLDQYIFVHLDNNEDKFELLLHMMRKLYSFVAGECARGIADVSLEYDLPIGFGVLTVNNVDQALARAEAGEANKGREAALAALEMADLLERLS